MLSGHGVKGLRKLAGTRVPGRRLRLGAPPGKEGKWGFPMRLFWGLFRMASTGYCAAKALRNPCRNKALAHAAAWRRDCLDMAAGLRCNKTVTRRIGPLR